MTDTADPSAVLHAAELEIEGVLTDASNLSARVLLTDEDGRPTGERALYKPARGEAPLHDFPAGTLGHREVAAHLVSAAGGWDLIPCTIFRDGPLGPGSVQLWVDWEAAGTAPGTALLEAFPAEEVPEGWLAVVHGEDAEGRAVAVAHRDAPDLASMAVLDLVLNNADRKGAHLVRDATGRLWGFDHGLTFHVADKLRTVLWGWGGQPLPDADRERLDRLRAHLAEDPGAIAGHLGAEELAALAERVDGLVDHPVFPHPPTDRYGLPWPLW